MLVADERYTNLFLII